MRGVKARTLLAVLALHRGEPVATDRLIDIVWGEEPPGKPANALQALVVALRRAIGADKVVTTDAGYALAHDAGGARRRALRAHSSPKAAASLESGDATLASETFGRRVGAVSRRAARGVRLRRVRHRRTGAARRAAARRRSRRASMPTSRWAVMPSSSAELESLCDAHPLRERLWELRMLALYRSGRQADALRVYADRAGRFDRRARPRTGAGPSRA